jgi:hypothetical protein
MSNGYIIVCTDILHDDINYSRSVIVGRKFLCLQPAFVKPYLSSDYGIYLGLNLSEFIEKWPITSVTAKIQVLNRSRDQTSQDALILADQPLVFYFFV